MRTRLYIATIIAVFTFVPPAQAGDFHDMWLGQWKAHTAPFQGWDKVTRTVVPELDGGNYSGLFFQSEECVNDVYDCRRSGEVQVAESDRLTMYATLLHELGHARDWLVMTDADRARFANTMGYNPNPEAWWDYLKPDGYRSPGELFAEANEYCGLSGRQRRDIGYFWGRHSGRLYGGVYQWRPTHQQARAVCASLR